MARRSPGANRGHQKHRSAAFEQGGFEHQAPILIAVILLTTVASKTRATRRRVNAGDQISLELEAVGQIGWPLGEPGA